MLPQHPLNNFGIQGHYCLLVQFLQTKSQRSAYINRSDTTHIGHLLTLAEAKILSLGGLTQIKWWDAPKNPVNLKQIANRSGSNWLFSIH